MTRADEIQKTLWELKEVEEEHWKLLAAEYVVQQTTSKDIDSFTLGGILSQAAMSIESGHLENAVILELKGLEAAMT